MILKNGFCKADFSKKMYKEIKFAIIKPGLGTIEECLKRGYNYNFLH